MPFFLSALERGYEQLGVLGARVLLAVSGGADSTALLLGTARLVVERRIECAVASLDHGLRPEAGEEVRRVEALAGRLGLPFRTRSLGLVGGARTEERARAARYAALEEVRAELAMDWIATAHTADDQAETLLMRLSRGTALRGAAGILARRGRIIRPMLRCTRAQVEEFLAREAVEHARDPMNGDPAFLRVRIRTGVLPALASAAGERAVAHLAAFSGLAQEDDALLSLLADEAFERLRVRAGALDAAGLRALLPPLRRRVVARLLEEASVPVDLALIERALEGIGRGGRLHLRRGLELRCAGGLVRCATTTSPRIEPRSLRPGERIEAPAAGLAFTLSAEPPAGRVPFLALGGDVLFPLVVRGRQPGDRVHAGPGGGRRKLQDILVDAGTPAEERDRIPVVTDAGGAIVWVVGIWPRGAPSPRSPGSWYLAASPLSDGASFPLQRPL